MDKGKISLITDMAAAMRRDIIEMGYSAKKAGAHFGPALSCTDLVASMFFGIMTHDPHDPYMEERDRFVLSKGHACLAYYAALIESGYIPRSMMKTFKADQTNLCGHPSMHPELGIDVSSGSLGNGFSLACGMAEAALIKGEKHHVFCVMGDGECDEGIVWEAALNAAKYRLDNLIAAVDINGFQLSGHTKDVMPVNLNKMWTAAGWDVRELKNGNDVNEILPLLKELNMCHNGQPHVILAKTIKGKGVSFMEGNLKFHAAPIDEAQYKQAIADLDAAKKEAKHDD